MHIAIANAGICSGIGGAERAAIRLAHEMRARGHAVHLLTCAGGRSPVYSVDPRIPVHFFDNRFFAAEIATMALGPSLLREHRIDVLVAFESGWAHLLWQLCCRGTRIPFVCSERTDPLRIETILWNRPGRLSLLEHCAAIHELLPCHAAHVPPHLQDRTFVIPNAPSVEMDFHDSFPDRKASPPQLLYLGRLVAVKRPLLLLQAFALLASEFPDWIVSMTGERNDIPSLAAFVREQHLEDRVRFGPPSENSYLAANIYCLPSQYEGFPNTVLEAMAAGLPIVGVQDCPAMASIVRHGVTGLLAKQPTPESLAEALRPLMASEKTRVRMGRAAWQECREHYAPSSLFDQWERELKAVVTRTTT